MKSQIFQYFLVIIGCMSLTQCQKDNDYYDTFVGGYIIATHDLKPVPNALTELVQVEDTRLPTSAFNYVVLDSMVVGTTGRFKFNFTAKKGSQYGIRARHPRYLYSPTNVSFFSPGSSNQDSVVHGMNPYSYLRVHIKDTSSIENYLGIYFFALNQSDDVTIWKNPLDTTVILQHVYFPLWFSWQLKYANNRVGSRNVDGATCRPLDTCDIHIKF
jgi:hypothetical protein